MKFFFASVLILFAGSPAVHAGLPPLAQAAIMEASYASGFYASARRGAIALIFNEEGSADSFAFSAAGRKLNIKIEESSLSPCGNRYFAQYVQPENNTSTSIELFDYSKIQCRLYVKFGWQATISTLEPDGSISRLALEGDPTL